MADLRLDIKDGAMAARKNGSPIVPGKPDDSLLVKRIYSDNPGFRMPPTFSHKTLTAEQKEILRRWIAEGAAWTQHWSFVPPVKAPVPAVKSAEWPRNEIDRFVLAKLEANGLQPAAEADRRSLIRRVTLDLTGLLPTPQEVLEYVNDKSHGAYERVVDRLLASPRYGEHRARYWLDAARYADTQGLHFDNYREMWPYRDWVIKAFNANMPFDRFTVEQLGGDLLPHATLDQKIASGFQRCTVTTNEGGSIPAEVEAMYAKDRADTTGTVWLGLTVGCATCHDHKFDPISQKDYYSLTSFFRNTTQPTMDMNIRDTPPVVDVPSGADRAKWDALTAERDALREQLAAERNKQLASGEFLKASAWREEAVHYDSLSRAFEVRVGESAETVRSGKAEPLALPEHVSVADAAAAHSKALRIDKNGSVSLPSVDVVDSDKPFTMAAWVYIPKALKGSISVAHQYEKIAGAKPGEKQRRGWELAIDTGNLGIYAPTPSLYMSSGDGTYISARPSPEFSLQAEGWHHVQFTYDGSRAKRGLSLYVNGAAVPVVGHVGDAQQLGSSIYAHSALVLGGNENDDAEPASFSEFTILNRSLDPEEAQAFYHASSFGDAARKPQSDLSEAERSALASYYVEIVDPATRDITARLHRVEREWHAIRERSATTFVMQERTDSQPVAHVLYRGQYDQMRDEVTPRAPSVLPPMTQAMPRNRLGLAMWIVDASNPLTARVTVNRFWQEIFGIGLVKTVEDFGSQGEPPTNPELLDWLAVDFQSSGWDVKALFRKIVTSATYRQSAETTTEKIAKDPDNRLLSHGPRFRMDGEMVRDCALFASGLLRPSIGGPSVKPYQPTNIWETVAMLDSDTRFYKQDSGDELYRRSLYTFWKRAAPPPSMDIFNAPSREMCTVRRERTDTPLQALVTMNDPQFVEAARVLAQTALETTKQFADETNYMATRLLARPLEAKELDVLGRSYSDFLAYYSESPADAGKLLQVGEAPLDSKLPKPKLAALTMVANELMNLDEVLVK